MADPLPDAVRAVYDAAEAIGPTRYAGGMRVAVIPAIQWARLRAAIIALGNAADIPTPEAAWSQADTAVTADGG